MRSKLARSTMFPAHSRRSVLLRNRGTAAPDAAFRRGAGAHEPRSVTGGALSDGTDAVADVAHDLAWAPQALDDGFFDGYRRREAAGARASF